MDVAVTECPVSLENSYTIQFEPYNIKIELMRIINITIKEKSSTQTEIAKILGVDQPKISYIKNLRTFGFSLSRLLSFLLKLGYDIDLKINNLAILKVDSNTKLELMYLIKSIITKHNLSQDEAATLMHISQSKVSRINKLITERLSGN